MPEWSLVSDNNEFRHSFNKCESNLGIICDFLVISKQCGKKIIANAGSGNRLVVAEETFYWGNTIGYWGNTVGYIEKETTLNWDWKLLNHILKTT